MKKSLLICAFALASITLWTGCNDNDDDPKPSEAKTTITMEFAAKVDGNNLLLNDTFSDYLGRPTSVETFKYYLSNIYLIDASLNKTLIKDVLLVDHSKGATSFTVEVPAKAYQQIEIGIGLNASQNASDPAGFEDSHPLSTAQNTYWSWAAKYKFIQIDGKTDTDNNGSLEQLFGYHTGLDTMYTTLTIDYNLQAIAQQNTGLGFEVDINEIFSKVDTVDCAIEPSWHGNTATASIAFRLTENFKQSLAIEP
jgi:hypothetical protein